MSLELPPFDSPVRALFDVAELAQICAPGVRHKLPGMTEARASAVKFLSQNPFAKSVNSIVLRTDGAIHLMEFGPKGGSKVRWRFCDGY